MDMSPIRHLRPILKAAAPVLLGMLLAAAVVALFFGGFIWLHIHFGRP